MDANNKTVLVGISGGVDSAMAALMLKQQGYHVIGCTMSIWDDSVPITQSTKSGCFGPGEAEDLKSAQNICERLGIPHHIIKLQNDYKSEVLSYFCNTYLDGKTPNPCLMCNQRMKFGLLPLTARKDGIEYDFFATGHYVRVAFNQDNGRYQLLKAIDKTKDQSYFLCFLHQDQLTNLIFPLGEKNKKEIKALAAECGYADLAEKAESQDFLETDDYGVLFEQGTFSEGDIVDTNGKKIGRHRGLIHYTIGQRKDLGLSGMNEPHYVLEIQHDTNTLVAGPKQYLYYDRLTAHSLNWISIPAQDKPFTCTARIRLQHQPAACTAVPLSDGRIHIIFEEPQLSITPGQAVVLYDNDLVLMGGIID